MNGIRRRHDDPPAIAKLGWRYHHLGIPHGAPRDGERHLQQLGVHVCGFETSPYGIEWMRFDPQCPVPEVVKTVPHLAFAVDDLGLDRCRSLSRSSSHTVQVLAADRRQAR